MVNASNITQNSYFGMVINNQNIIPEFIVNDKYWYLMGYFLRNGYIKNDNIYFVVKSGKKLNTLNEIILLKQINNSLIYYSENIGWLNVLKKFYRYGKKIIPEFIQDAPQYSIKHFINGYYGFNNYKRINIRNISCDMAYNFHRLFLKLGYILLVKTNKLKTFNLCGELNTKNKYGFIENNYVWLSLRKITNTKINNKIKVYNFEVENDNSYIVENIIAHNCQPFSIAGEKKGFEDTRSNVFWKLIEIMTTLKPKVVILENVKNLKTHDNGNTFKKIIDEIEKINYKYEILNTSEITPIPQNRERIYIICFLKETHYEKFEFPDKIDDDEKFKITDMIEDENNIDESYYYTDKLKIWNEIETSVVKNVNTNTIYQYRRFYTRENKNNQCPTLTANMSGGGHNVPLIKDDNGIRKLTPRECFNFQGFPQKYILPDNISKAGLYKLAGNAVSYPVVKKIAKSIIKIMDEN